MIRLNCFFQANNDADYRNALVAALELTSASKKHEGNIAYDTFQSATRSDVFMICETWADQASLEKHSATPEFEKNVTIINSCGMMKIEKFEF